MIHKEILAASVNTFPDSREIFRLLFEEMSSLSFPDDFVERIPEPSQHGTDVNRAVPGFAWQRRQ